MFHLSEKLNSYFVDRRTALAFLLSILIWGVAGGCFAAVLNNYLADVRMMDQLARGWLEFFREIPGLCLVFLMALLCKCSDWKIFRIAVLISMMGLIGLMFSSQNVVIVGLIVVWSVGEHLLQPIRSTIPMHVARPEMVGHSLGFATSAMNAGHVIGNLLAAIMFFLLLECFHLKNQIFAYNVVWCSIILLLIVVSVLLAVFNPKNATPVKRPRLYFNKKYNKFYGLELFYGARKQIFLTFAPYVLILHYGFSTSKMAMLLGVCSLLNIFAAPLIGKLADRIGYKNIMIYDTVILFFVCLIYGYADKLFVQNVACIVMCVNFLLDGVISTTSMATGMYVRDISRDREEIASTLSTGISMNHLISIIAALAGGWAWKQWGVGVLFSFAAVMALANSALALTIPSPKRLPGNLQK